VKNRQKKFSLGQYLDKNLGYIFLIPGILCLLLLVAFPVLVTIWQSMTNLTFLRKSNPKFVGLENFRYLFKQQETLVGLKNSIIWTVLSVSLQLFLGFLFAQLLHRITRGKGFFRTALIIPWTFPAIVMAYTWRWMLDPAYGIINQLLYNLGIIKQYTAWFSLKGSLFVAIIMNVWFGVPFMVMAIYAGFKTIPDEYYEVAKIEGTNYFQELKYVTIPCLKRIIGIILVLRTIWVFNNFDFIYLTTAGGPGYMSQTLPIYSYKMMWKNTHTARASAISVILLIFVAIFVVLYFKLFRVGGEADE